MDVLIVAFCLAFIISFIVFIVLSILKKNIVIVSKIMFASYTAYVGLAAFSDSSMMEGLATFLTIELIYLVILTIVLIIKNKDSLFKWLIGDSVLILLYTLNYIALGIQSKGFLNSLAEGMLIPIGLIYIVVIALIMKDNEYTKRVIRVLISCYVIFTIAISIAPPFEVSILLMTLLLSIVVGAIGALILFILYKRVHKSKAELKEKGDFS